MIKGSFKFKKTFNSGNGAFQCMIYISDDVIKKKKKE